MKISSYPEKFTNEINVEINADQEDHCIIILASQTGRILRMMGVNITKGNNQVHVDNVNSLEAGLYHLSVKNTHSITLYTSSLTKF